MNAEELKIRISMCKFCIEVLETKAADDPRQPDALAHYREQLAGLEAKYDVAMSQRLEDMLPKPPDIVIGLKPAQLFGKVPK